MVKVVRFSGLLKLEKNSLKKVLRKYQMNFFLRVLRFYQARRP
jgi:hypothetical protein